MFLLLRAIDFLNEGISLFLKWKGRSSFISLKKGDRTKQSSQTAFSAEGTLENR
jgi:hypothetical protein